MCWNGSSWELWSRVLNPLSISAGPVTSRARPSLDLKGCHMFYYFSVLSDNSIIFSDISKSMTPTRVLWWFKGPHKFQSLIKNNSSIYVLGTLCEPPCNVSSIIPKVPSEVGIFNLLRQRKKWSLWEVKGLAHGYLAVKKQNQDLNPELFISTISGLNYYIFIHLIIVCLCLEPSRPPLTWHMMVLFF